MSPIRLRHGLALSLLAGVALLAPSRTAEAFDPFLVVPDPSVAEASPAYRYANMTDAEAFTELDKRKVLYSKVDSAPGVRAPIRLTGRLHGVYIHSSLPPEERVTTPYEILDARLALALDDFAAVLERHDIDEVVHYTMYRPGSGVVHEHGVSPEQEAKVSDHSRSSSGAKSATMKAAVPTKGLATPQRPALSGVKSAPLAKPIAALPPLPAPTLAPSLGKGALSSTKGPTSVAARSKQKNGELAAKPAVTIAGKPAPIAPSPRGGPAGAAATLAKKRASASVASVVSPGATPAEKGALPSLKKPVVSASKPATTGNDPAPGTRHPAGLAIDVGLVHKKDGRWMSVVNMFKGHIGDKTCGEGARVADDADAKEMRSLVCEPSERGLFTYILTPNYNQAHSDHFHMEIRPAVRWFLHH